MTLQMKRMLFGCLIGLVLLPISCRKEEPSTETSMTTTETAVTETTDTAAATATSVTSPTGPVAGPLTTGVKHLVKVEFEGGMSHIMGRSNNKPSRTAFLKNDMTPHFVRVVLPIDPAIANDPVKVEAERVKIANATGKTVVRIPGKGFEVKNATGLIFRIVDPSTNKAMQPGLSTTTDFDFLVPRLSKVANVVESDLDPDLDKDPGNKFVGFFELDGGVLSASPFCMRARFDPDTEGRGKRAFVHRVTLTGFTAAPAILRVTKAGPTTTDLSFGNVDLVRIFFENQPNSTGNPHFDMHKNVAPNKPWPAIKDIEAFCAVSDTVPGCANTSWP